MPEAARWRLRPAAAAAAALPRDLAGELMQGPRRGEEGDSGDRRCGGDRARQIFFWLMGAKAEGVEGIREASTQRAADAWLQQM